MRFLIFILLAASCQQLPDRKEDCPGFLDEKTGRDAILFFHKPISGSTYEMLLFPVCNSSDTNQSKDVFFPKLGDGISFNVTSDDERYKRVFKEARNIHLNNRDSLAWNLQNIYYKYVNVNILSDVFSPTSEYRTAEKKLIMDSGEVLLLKYQFLSSVGVTINEGDH